MSARFRIRPGDDRGASLMELVVGMAIMMVFLGIFSGAMMMMTKSQTKTSAVTETAAQVNSAFLWLDKTVRYAAAISTPGQSTGPGATKDWYVELRNTTSGKEACTQLRLHVATQQLQRRSWQVNGATFTPPSTWQPVASGFANAEAAPGDADQPFFSAARATGSEAYQQLRITLVAKAGPAKSTTSRSSFTFTAINSSLPKSTTAICQEAGRQ